MSIITVKNITKEFKITKKGKGFLNACKSLIIRDYEIKKAVSDVSFDIKKGELVGYIGANGAGKSTTIKMLCGILTPTYGGIKVNGYIPYVNRKENSLRIGVVFGQRSQLYWDVPMEETFEIYKQMYKINDSDYKRNLAFFIELLDMKEFIGRPIRQLSLGQKMKANLAVALLHNPEILYLDEPTIGLDVLVKSKIRQFIKEVNNEKKTTVILTTHDMDDIEQICNRIIMIDKGQKLYDGSLDQFKGHYSSDYILVVEFKEEFIEISDRRLRLIKNEGLRKHFAFNHDELSVAEAITQITRKYNISDIKVKEPQIEEIIKKIYLSDEKIEVGSAVAR